MKRRDFLLRAAGATAGMMSGMARAVTKPCPPGNISTGTMSNTTQCGPTSAPGWFLDLPEGIWTEIAAGEARSDLAPWRCGTKFDEVIPGAPGDYLKAMPRGAGPNVEGPAAIFADWTGACVDQDRREFILAANGGHAGYPGNEVYVLELSGSVPKWARISDPTPWEYLRSDAVAPGAAFYSDFAAPATYGRMRAVHSYNRPAYANGRVWYAAQDGYTSLSGGSTGAVWSFDRAGFVQGRFKKTWSIVENPWTHHGTPDLPTATNLAPYSTYASVYDPISRKVWSFSKWTNSDASLKKCWTIDTDTGQVAQVLAPIGDNEFGGGWGVAAPDMPVTGQTLAFFSVIGSTSLMAWNVTTNAVFYVSPTNTKLWVDPSRYVADSQTNKPGHGAVFHKASRSILVYEPTGMGSTIRRLRIPDDPVRGTYAWTDMEARPGGVTPTPCKNGVYSKFNIVQDMGNGQACLVVATGLDKPAYVYKMASSLT